MQLKVPKAMPIPYEVPRRARLALLLSFSLHFQLTQFAIPMASALPFACLLFMPCILAETAHRECMEKRTESKKKKND